MSHTRDAMRRDTRLSGLVRRYHSWPVLTTQSVGEHSWQVLRIYIEIFGPPSPDVTTYIVYHDSAELATGDPPFPLKRDHPELKEIYARMEHEAMLQMRGVGLPELDPRERARVKVCDLLEMWEHGRHELQLGNQYAHPIVRDTLEAALAIAHSKVFTITDCSAVEYYIRSRS